MLHDREIREKRKKLYLLNIHAQIHNKEKIFMTTIAPVSTVQLVMWIQPKNLSIRHTWPLLLPSKVKNQVPCSKFCPPGGFPFLLFSEEGLCCCSRLLLSGDCTLCRPICRPCLSWPFLCQLITVLIVPQGVAGLCSKIQKPVVALLLLWSERPTRHCAFLGCRSSRMQ